jgi:ureidoglycolate dehydrogenase (NAD+)
MNSTRFVAAPKLREWISKALSTVGVPAEDAEMAAAMLVQVSLWGIDSHGVARATHYLNRLSRGSIVAAPGIAFERTAAGTGQVDGAHGLGLVVCHYAMARAIDLAREAGVGVVGVKNSSHCGAIGLYARQATQAGMIGIAFTHSDAFVVPHGGVKPFFGTNPIAIGIPSSCPGEPLCLDMATSIAPWNRVMNARRENKPVAPGIGVDADGLETTNPHEIAAVKPAAEHKGYALAFAIDMLCGPLNGMKFGPHLTPMYAQLDKHRELGSLMIAIDPSRFAGGATLAAVVLTAITEAKGQQKGVSWPGEPEYRSAARRAVEGIPVDAALLADFATWADRLSVGLPPELA